MSQEEDGKLGIKEAAQTQNSSSPEPQRASSLHFPPVARLNVSFLHWYVVDAPYAMGQINPCPCLNPCIFSARFNPHFPLPRLQQCRLDEEQQ